ncbi:hypothetical protein HK096_001885 [Nowakowskiella sp. JEL0078]|nr:hypothetical protein HK096_001885 [Nowakowskiella sp. JEL0078]
MKRGSEKQITKDDRDRDDDDQEEDGIPQMAAAEVLKKRVIKKIPSRLSSQKSIGQPSTPSSSLAVSKLKPSTEIKNSTSPFIFGTLEVAGNSKVSRMDFKSTTPPSIDVFKPSKFQKSSSEDTFSKNVWQSYGDENSGVLNKPVDSNPAQFKRIEELAKNLKGLNISLIKELTNLLEEDYFANIGEALQSITNEYLRHRSSLDSKFSSEISLLYSKTTSDSIIAETKFSPAYVPSDGSNEVANPFASTRNKITLQEPPTNFPYRGFLPAIEKKEDEPISSSPNQDRPIISALNITSVETENNSDNPLSKSFSFLKSSENPNGFSFGGFPLTSDEVKTSNPANEELVKKPVKFSFVGYSDSQQELPQKSEAHAPSFSFSSTGPFAGIQSLTSSGNLPGSSLFVGSSNIFGGAASASMNIFGSLKPALVPSNSTITEVSEEGVGCASTASSNPFANILSIPKPALLSSNSTLTIEDGDGEDLPLDPQLDNLTMMKGEGEESDDVIFESRAKVFQFKLSKWVPIGLGVLKVNQNKIDSKKRVLMRADSSGRVLLNSFLFKEMKPHMEKSDAKELTMNMLMNSAAEGEPVKMVLSKLLVRFKSSNDAKKLFDVLKIEE